MKNKMLHRMVALGAGVLCSLAVASTARAELVSYNFTGTVDKSTDSIWKAGQGINGSFAYDSDAWDWVGGEYQYGFGMNLKLDGLDPLSITTIAFDNGTFKVSDYVGVPPFSGYAAKLTLTGQSLGSDNFPTSLSLGGGSSGSLRIDIYRLFGNDTYMVASLTSLTSNVPGGGTSTPELDPRSGTGALALLLGGLGVVLGRRRRS